jgi:hypothetical protein
MYYKHQNAKLLAVVLNIDDEKCCAQWQCKNLQLVQFQTSLFEPEVGAF